MYRFSLFPIPTTSLVRKTVQHLLAEYGSVALVVYFAIFFGVLFAFWAAFRFGWSPESVGGQVGTLTAAYLATKVTQPLRIAATIAVTPIVVAGMARVRKKSGAIASSNGTPGGTQSDD